MHPLGSEFTWYSQKKNGFRVDHILLSVGLRNNIKNADFSNKDRELKTSGHSALVADIKTDK
jgi:exodeoxyribonuclease III